MRENYREGRVLTGKVFWVDDWDRHGFGGIEKDGEITTSQQWLEGLDGKRVQVIVMVIPDEEDPPRWEGRFYEKETSVVSGRLHTRSEGEMWIAGPGDERCYLDGLIPELALNDYPKSLEDGLPGRWDVIVRFTPSGPWTTKELTVKNFSKDDPL